MPTLEEQLKRSVELLEAYRIDFALAGGVAASIYREEERITKDIDFIVGGKGNVLELSRELLQELDLEIHLARKADLDGGPLFAIRKKNTPVLILLGRDPKKRAPGVDLLLPENIWVPRALERAQLNKIDWGFKKLPTLTVEDLIIAKLFASKAKEREQDILDLRSIFRAKHELDTTYLVARMKEYSLQIPNAVSEDAPELLRKASKRITRSRKNMP